MSAPIIPVTINSGRLIWCGEHWIAYLREPGADSDTAMLSLFQTRYSSAGEGHVAFVKIPGAEGFQATFTDNRDLAAFINDRFIRQGPGLFDPAAPIADATITREGDIRIAPSWVIRTSLHRVVATWRKIQAPVIAEGTFRPGTEHFTILFFSDDASIEFDQRPLPGRPYPRDIWKKTIGGERSSCVFAIAETFIELAE